VCKRRLSVRPSVCGSMSATTPFSRNSVQLFDALYLSAVRGATSLPPTNKIPISLNQAKHPHWSPDIATWSQRRRVSSWEHTSSHGHSEKRNTASCRAISGMTGCSRGSGAYRLTSKLRQSETSTTVLQGDQQAVTERKV